jgi:hypothetical protein
MIRAVARYLMDNTLHDEPSWSSVARELRVPS